MAVDVKGSIYKELFNISVHFVIDQESKKFSSFYY